MPLRPRLLAAALAFTAALPLSIATALAQAPAAAPDATAPKPPTHADASAPIPKKDDGTFIKRHQGFLDRAKSGPIGLLFLGDSITDNWAKAPHIWEHFYGAYQPANFGIGGDTTQNVVWRITNGELDGIHPRVTVLMLGTNNSSSHNAAEIFAADKKIIGMIREKIPETKVLLLAIFPRGPRKNRDNTDDPWEKRMEVINAVNTHLATLDDGVNVRFLDIGKAFLDDSGHIPHILFPDQLHPNAAGYELWAEAMQPLLKEMLGDHTAPKK